MRRSVVFAVKKELATPQGPGVNGATHPLNTGDQVCLFPDGRLAIARVSPCRVEWRAPDGQRTVSRVLGDASPPIMSRMKQEVMQRFALDEEGNSKFKPIDADLIQVCMLLATTTSSHEMVRPNVHCRFGGTSGVTWSTVGWKRDKGGLASVNALVTIEMRDDLPFR